MVKAIKYWSLAYKILQEDPNKNSRAMIPTSFGKQLLGSGWDPYLEDVR